MSKKEFNIAVVRIFCDMILADGYIAKEELVELAKIAKDYRLVKDTSKKVKTIDDARQRPFPPRLLDSLDAKIIQEAYTISFAQALEDIKSWDKEHHDDVSLFVKQLSDLSQADGECSPNEARIRLAVQYILEKDAFVFSVNKDYKFSKKEVIYIENDISNDNILKTIEIDCQKNELSDIRIGYEEYKLSSDNISNETNSFQTYLSEYYNKINREIKANFLHYQRELKLLGFDFVYIPQTIDNLNHFGEGTELLMPTLQIINPVKLYGREFERVIKILKKVQTHDFTNALLHECHEKIPSATPSLLLKIKTSDVINSLDNQESHKQKYSDFLVVKIENGNVGNTIAKFLSIYLSITKRLSHMVLESYDNRVNIHGFEHTLLDYAVNKVYGKEVITRVEIDLSRPSVSFVFGEGQTSVVMNLSARAMALYILIMYKALPQPIMNDMDFEKDVALQKKYHNFYTLYKECAKIYGLSAGARKIRINIFKKGVLQGAKNDLIDAFKTLRDFPNKERYIPKLKRKEEVYDIDRHKINMNIVFVKAGYGQLTPLNLWWKGTIEEQKPLS